MRRISAVLAVCSAIIGTMTFVPNASALSTADHQALTYSSGRTVTSPVAAGSPSTNPDPCWPAATGESAACETTDPQVTFWGYGDFSSQPCTVSLTFDWGDKTKQETVVKTLNGAGTFSLGTHTYKVPGTFTVDLTASALSGCEAGSASQSVTIDGFATPASWTTKPVKTLTPGVDPLNVIISAESTVTISQILSSMTDAGVDGNEPWVQVGEGKNIVLGHCMSEEEADVGGGMAPATQYWRLGSGCISANVLSEQGNENHARLWQQTITGAPNSAAWFVSASYETACWENSPGIVVPWYDFQTLNVLKVWHCIDGSPGSFQSNGYNRGAAAFVKDVKAGAAANGWKVTVQSTPSQAGVGECHEQDYPGTSKPEPCAQFGGTATVITVDD